MSPKVPKAYLDARRTEILDAAMKCFIEFGFHNTTMQDIYKKTNLSPGAVYNYFNSKEDIIAAATEISQQRNTEMIIKATSGNPDDALINLVQSFLSFTKQVNITSIASVDLALYSEANRNKHICESLRNGQNSVLDKLVEFVKFNQHKGVFNNKLDPIAISHVLISIFQGIELHSIIDPNFNLDSYGAVYESIIRGTFSKSQRVIKKNKSKIEPKSTHIEGRK